MSVVLETTYGPVVIDLLVKEAPNACRNFCKLAKVKYYTGNMWHNVQSGLLIQSGDPDGDRGCSIYGKLYGEQAKYFEAEIHPRLRHNIKGTVSMASMGKGSDGQPLHGSQFFITTRDDATYLDGKHTIFGRVSEGMDAVARIDASYCDDDGRPYRNVRIKHVFVLEDPFDDPDGLERLIPAQSPTQLRLNDRPEAEEPLNPDKDLTEAEVEEKLRQEEARSRAEVLEMVGDLPAADIEPPKDVLFVCKLNPATTQEDLEVIFARFGKIRGCEVICDRVSGESLGYGFVEFESEESCVMAYTKMENVLIDERRIHVDFCQSVAKLWFNRNSARRATHAQGVARGGAKWGPRQGDDRGAQRRRPRAEPGVQRTDTRKRVRHGGSDGRGVGGGSSGNRSSGSSRWDVPAEGRTGAATTAAPLGSKRDQWLAKHGRSNQPAPSPGASSRHGEARSHSGDDRTGSHAATSDRSRHRDSRRPHRDTRRGHDRDRRPRHHH